MEGDGQYSHNSYATISATALAGHKFSGWTGDGVTDPNSPVTEVRMNKNQTISASFELQSYQVVISAENGGTVNGSGFYPYGSNIPILAIPRSGYSFDQWKGATFENLLAPSTNVLVDADLTVLGTFKFAEHVSFLEGSDIGNNWFITWMGGIFASSSNWFYHTKLGWVYPHLDQTGIWLWQNALSWIWTTKEYYKQGFLWSASHKTWIFLGLNDSTTSRYFNFKKDSWISW